MLLYALTPFLVFGDPHEIESDLRRNALTFSNQHGTSRSREMVSATKPGGVRSSLVTMSAVVSTMMTR